MDFETGLEAALESVNAGAPIATIDPYLVERMWEALSRIPRDPEQRPAVHLAAKLHPDLAPRNPEQKLAMMLRYVLMNALIEIQVGSRILGGCLNIKDFNMSTGPADACHAIPPHLQ